MDLYDIERKYFTLRLDEAAGMITNYNNIGEELYTCISSIEPELIEPGLYMRRIDNYRLNYDCFIKKLNIKYYSSPKETNSGGKFIPEVNKEHLSKDKKLMNITIQINEKTDDPNMIDKNYFLRAFSHEIEHAYRYYSILSKNNGSLSNAVNKANGLYTSASNAQYDTKYGSRVFDMLKRAVYLIDNDETPAFVNQTYEEMRQKTYINRFNITEHFNEFRMYRENDALKTIVDVFDDLIKTEKGRNICNEFLEQAYGDRFTGNKAIKMFRQRLIGALDHRIDKFLKIINKALIDFNRIDKNIQYEPDEMRLEEFVHYLDLIF